MFRTMLLASACLASATLITSSSASAQEGVLAELYGRGVHNYYAGDYTQAHEYLTMAIDNGSKDPRPYYFRGLVLDATGRPEEAESDYRTGATLEAQSNMGSLIGRSLARVQGSRRLEIERIRQETRLQVKMNQDARAKARYEERQANEAQVLRNPPPRPRPAPTSPPADVATDPTAPAANNGNEPAVADDESATNPFADDGGTASGTPMVEADDALGDPLADAAAAEAASESATPEPAQPSGDGGNVFEELGSGDDSDPFQSGLGDSAPAEEDSSGEDENPFAF